MCPRRFEIVSRGAAIDTHSAPPVLWPEDVLVRLSKVQLNPTLMGLLYPASIARGFDGIARSA